MDSDQLEIEDANHARQYYQEMRMCNDEVLKLALNMHQLKESYDELVPKPWLQPKARPENEDLKDYMATN